MKRILTLCSKLATTPQKQLPQLPMYPQMQIYSLSNSQLLQLSHLTTYSKSISYLTQNNIPRALQYLRMSQMEATDKYPSSVHLHTCLLNRTAILYKLLNEPTKLLECLLEIYLRILCSKGVRSIQTSKHLLNYALALIIYDPQAALPFFHHLKLNNQYNHTLDLCYTVAYVQQHLEERVIQDQSYTTINNNAWLKHYLLIRNKTVSMNPREILEQYIIAMLKAQNCAKTLEGEEVTNSNKTMNIILEAFLNKEDKLDKINNKACPLQHEHSPIIAMNIAQILLMMNRRKQAQIFAHISIEKSISLKQVERVGFNTILLAKIQELQPAGNGEEMLLSILNNKEHYSATILKETLRTYAGSLFKRGRTIECEEYFAQSEQIEGNAIIEGLILPQFDFSF